MTMKVGVANFCRSIIVILTLVALVMQCLTMVSCELVELSSSGKTIGVFMESDGSGDHCVRSTYDTDDPFIKASRYMLFISILCGGIAGVMVFCEWVVCELFCAGCFEGLAFFLACWTSASTFVFYGAEVCQEEEVEELLEGYTWKNLVHNFFEEGDVNFTNQTRDQEEFGCEYTGASHFMTVASIVYFVCTILLCCTPQADPLLAKYNDAKDNFRRVYSSSYRNKHAADLTRI